MEILRLRLLSFLHFKNQKYLKTPHSKKKSIPLYISMFPPFCLVKLIPATGAGSVVTLPLSWDIPRRLERKLQFELVVD